MKTVLGLGSQGVSYAQNLGGTILASSTMSRVQFIVGRSHWYASLEMAPTSFSWLTLAIKTWYNNQGSGFL